MELLVFREVDFIQIFKDLINIIFVYKIWLVNNKYVNMRVIADRDVFMFFSVLVS